jgi:hypothetical protein
VLVSGGAARPLPRPFGVLLGSAPNAEYGLAYEQLAAADDVCVLAVVVR